jgi:hypothetical protein
MTDGYNTYKLLIDAQAPHSDRHNVTRGFDKATVGQSLKLLTKDRGKTEYGERLYLKSMPASYKSADTIRSPQHSSRGDKCTCISLPSYSDYFLYSAMLYLGV